MDTNNHRVTALTSLPRHPDRLAVHLGDAEVVVAIETAMEMRLSVGTELEPPAIVALRDAHERLETLDRAIRLLAVRGRSVRELRRRLLRAHETEAHVDAAIDQLLASGTLDDEEFSRELARSQMVGRGYAPRRLQQELARRGVARDVAERAIESVLADDSAAGVGGESVDAHLAAAIERLARKKLQTLASLDSRARSRRLYAFLARRGYENDAIRRVMTTLLADEEAVPDSA